MTSFKNNQLIDTLNVNVCTCHSFLNLTNWQMNFFLTVKLGFKPDFFDNFHVDSMINGHDLFQFVKGNVKIERKIIKKG